MVLFPVFWPLCLLFLAFAYHPEGLAELGWWSGESRHPWLGPECREEVFNLLSVTTYNMTLVFCFLSFGRNYFHLSKCIQCACVCTHLCIWIQSSVWHRKCAEIREQTWVSVLTLYLVWDRLLFPLLTVLQLLSAFQVFSCLSLCLSLGVITDVHHLVQPYVGLGIWTWILKISWQALYTLSHLCSPIFVDNFVEVSVQHSWRFYSVVHW